MPPVWSNSRDHETERALSPEILLKRPLVSIGITTFNRSHLLRQAVKSALNQTLDDFEIIVSNDNPAEPVGSRLGRLEECKAVTTIDQPRNLGVLDNMNDILARAKGLWFTWMSDDDLLSPHFLESAMFEINAAGNGACVGFFPSFTTNFAELKEKQSASSEGTRLLDPADVLTELAVGQIQTVGSGGVMWTDSLRRIGGITAVGTDFFPYCDTIIPLRLSEEGPVILSRKKLYGLRLHAGSESASSTNLSAFLVAQEDVIAVTKSFGFALPTDHLRSLMVALILRFHRDALVVARRERNPLRRARRIFSAMKATIRNATLASVPLTFLFLAAPRVWWEINRRMFRS